MAALSQSELQEEITELRDIVQDYKPGKNVTLPDKISFPENLFIGLFGRTGCGKSSLINSLKFAALGRLRKSQWVAVATQEKAGGHTMFRKIANLTQCIYVIDNRGLDNPDAEQAQVEIAAQLDGYRGYSEKVQWLGEEEGQGFDTPAVDLKKGHPITCAVFVFSAIHDLKSDSAGLNHLVDFLHRHQGCYPIAVITHVDVAERKEVDILAAVLRVSGISDIYQVANVTSEKTKLDEQYQLNLLNLIERCMTIGDDTAVFKHYQREELEQKAEIATLKAKVPPGQEAQSVDGTEKSQDWQKTEEERREVDKLKYDLEKRRMELEFLERDHKLNMEVEKQRHELQMERQKLESREMQLQEEERERRFQEELRKIEAEKREELTRIMEVNRSKGPRFQPVINLPGCPIQ